MPIKTLPLALEEILTQLRPLGRDGRSLEAEQVNARFQYWLDLASKQQGRQIAIWHPNSLDFACQLLALWQLGKVPLVPGNLLAPSLRSLARFSEGQLGDIPQLPESLTETLPQEAALVIYTSGSSGDPKPQIKTFDQLNAEQAMLERQWSPPVGTTYAGTVSHHHMYGLPFRLLWPLVSGRPFFAEDLRFWESLDAINIYDLIFVTSPVHLQNIPGNINLALDGRRFHRVFSAGGPLSEKIAIDACQHLGCEITEIYGSTETGALAWRMRPSVSPWQPLDNVEIRSVDSCLQVCSPSVQPGQWFAVQDRIELLDDGRFHLGERMDRIAKVGGKRVSLTQVESCLRAHPWVVDVRVDLLPERKSRLGALVQLTDEASQHLIDRGSREISQALGQALEDQIEAVAQPRYWRFLNPLPLTAEGKLPQVEFVRYFSLAERPRQPDILSCEPLPQKAGWQIELRVPPSLLYLEGHFPGRPVLPGVVQIGWAIDLGQQQFGNLGSFQALEVIKFQHIIQPGAPLFLQLQWDAAKAKLHFGYAGDKAGERVYSSGRIAFSGDVA